ncbi:Serine/threonine-protein kinase PrkC [Rosistilla ulvae]|uniref:non-specific serine/threonine protein kinase n=1 Tax=Rosistilla ulvae TaxID=1930277 RepID=A0A517M4F5_9BACT|nr:serine/threonine-protein kinase [Rosistilla ulvae]QDS89738.1 Serine/threonine-protein kinase PrkC [Rosistilla ulvae]
MPDQTSSNEPEESDLPDPIDEAFVAYLKARDAGGSDSRADFIERFPDLKSQLSELLDAADLIEQLAGSNVASENADPAADTRAGVRIDSIGDDLEATLAITPVPGEGAGPQLPFEMGDYVLESVLGRGGMGVVYLGHQKNLDRPVAVKMIRSGVLAGRDEIKRFCSEAKAAAKLKHPNIVTVHHFGLESGHYYFSMDYVEGFDLSKKVDDGPQDCREAARYVRDVAAAIHHAHQRGLLHRDLKPGNVLIDAYDQVHVTDFGLAKHVDAESSLTNSGAAIGTPNYMAPEQASGDHEATCPQSDVYSLGAILFALITGRPPFVTDSVMQTLMQVIHRPAPALRSLCDAPEDLDTIIEKCLQKEPQQRYASAEALAEDLDRFLNDQPIKARPRTSLQRGLDWLSEVPIFAALIGRRLMHTSDSHRRFQSTMLLFVLSLPMLLAAGLFGARMLHDRLPSEPKIAGGPAGDVYAEVAGELADRLHQAVDRPVVAIQTQGSVENLEHLLAGDVDLAILQASAVRGEQVSVIAPLYYEAVHLLARRDAAIDRFAEVAGHRVAIGGQGSGSQLAAHMLFDSLGLAESDIEIVYQPFQQSQGDATIPLSIACVARGSKIMAAALQSQQFQLLAVEDPLNISLDHPTLRPLQILPADYPAADLPADGIATVGTTAFLATRRNSPAVLVTATLEALYRSEISVPRMITRQQAAEWQGLALHPAARAFYESE